MINTKTIPQPTTLKREEVEKVVKPDFLEKFISSEEAIMAGS